MKKFNNIALTLLVMLTTLMPTSIMNISAEESYVTVDDTVVNNTGDHYFTYTEAVDQNGATGWAADTKTSIGGIIEGQTQHWVWNQSYEEASKHTYSFTFTGTGVDIMGVKNDDYNNFQLNDGEIEKVAINSGGVVALYSVRDLDFGVHTVNVTLPEGGTGLQVSYANVYGTNTSIKTSTIDFKKTSGDGNYFTYSTDGWSSFGEDNDHVWSDASSSDLAKENIWYEVSFVGTRIDVYAGKNHPMGEVEYFINGESQGIYDLYNSYNISSTLIASFDVSDTNGEHTFKAVAVTDNKPIDCSKVIVYHEEYEVTGFDVEQTNYLINEGATQKINYTVSPDYATIDDMKYTSTNSAVVAVDTAGMMSAEGKGTATITLSSVKHNLNKNIAVEVVESTPAIHGSIVEISKQYTQDSYQEVEGLGLLNKEIQAWKNDTVVSEIALISKDSKLKNVTVSASDLVSEDTTISKENIETFFIKSTQAYTGAFLGFGSTSRPVPEDDGTNRAESSDILYTDETWEIPYNSVQPVWVEFNIPSNAEAGVYTTTLTVTADGIDTPLTFEYTIDVKDITLADATEFNDSFDIELWQYPYSSAEYYGVEAFSDEHFDILEQMMELYKSIGGSAITTTILEDAWAGQTYSANEVHYPSMVKWTKESDGSFTYDYTEFDAWVSFCKEMGLGDKIVVYSIAPWHNSFTYWDNGVLKYEPFTVGSTRYTQVWTDFLTDLASHLTEKGWFESAHIGIDERGISATALDTIEAVTNSEGKQFKTATSMDHISEYYDLAVRVTDLNVGDNAAADNAELFTKLVNERNEKGYRTTIYSCTGHYPGNFSLSAPAESYWSVINAGVETNGFNRWAFDAWTEDPLNDTTHNAFEPGDCFVIYPDDKDAINPTPRSSVRLETMALGVRDINKIRFMVSEYPELQTQVDAMYAKMSVTAFITYVWQSPLTVQIVVNETEMFKNDLNDLTEAYLELVEENKVDKEMLADEVESALLISLQGYTTSSTKEFSDALNKAQDVLNDDEATQDNVDLALATLIEKIKGLVELEITVEKTEIAKGEEAYFKSNAPFSSFEKVLINGKVLDAKFYTAKEGSIIITLTEEYIATLEVGSYEITIVSSEGNVSATFEIVELETDFDSEEDEDADEDADVDADTETDTDLDADVDTEAEDNTLEGTSPDTNDTSNVMVYLSVFMISLLGLLTLRKRA